MRVGEHGYELAFAGTTMLAVACGESTEVHNMRHSRVLFDLRALTSMRASVADTAILSVVPARGDSQHIVRTLSRGDSVVTFNVSVETGDATFSAAVKSNNGTLLYDGQQTATINADGFRVVITLIARAPVLVVFPESILVNTTSASATLKLANKGNSTSIWRLVPRPPTCPSDSALHVLPDTGGIVAGDSDSVVVFRPPAPGPPDTLCILTFVDSVAGHVDVRVEARVP